MKYYTLYSITLCDISQYYVVLYNVRYLYICIHMNTCIRVYVYVSICTCARAGGLSESELERFNVAFFRFKDPDGPEMHKASRGWGSPIIGLGV